MMSMPSWYKRKASKLFSLLKLHREPLPGVSLGAQKQQTGSSNNMQAPTKESERKMKRLTNMFRN